MLDLLYHNLGEWRVGKGRVVKKEKFTAADQSKLVSYTDSSCEEEEDLHDEPIDLAIN